MTTQTWKVEHRKDLCRVVTAAVCSASMSGLTEANVEYVADAIKAVVMMDESDDIIQDPALEEPTRRS